MPWKEINLNTFLIGIKMINMKNAVHKFSIFNWDWVRAKMYFTSKDAASTKIYLLLSSVVL